MSWGPFMSGLEPGERKARLRSLRTCLHLLTGPRSNLAAMALLRAEIDDECSAALHDAATEFERLSALDRRRVLASYQAVSTPPRRARG